MYGTRLKNIKETMFFKNNEKFDFISNKTNFAQSSLAYNT